MAAKKTTNETSDHTLIEACTILNCSQNKFWGLLNSGDIEAYQLGSQIRVHRESLEQFKKRNKYVPCKKP